MNPHYYLMKNKKILRLEEEVSLNSLSQEVRSMLLEESDVVALDQNQANWRVVIFRDEIMELDEYQEWLSTGAHLEEMEEYELIAN